MSASSHSGNRAGQKLLGELVADFPKGFPACFVGAFHDDDAKWAKVTIEFLRSLGAKVVAPRLSDPTLDVARARRDIETAKFLYLDGGDTVAGVTHIAARGLVDAFQSAARTARAIFGLSGGACAAGPFTIGYDDHEQPYVAKCLALGAPVPLDVHDEDEWPEMRGLLQLVAKRRGLAKQGLVIPTGSVLVVEPDGSLASLGKKSCEQRKLAPDGSWVIGVVPQL